MEEASAGLGKEREHHRHIVHELEREYWLISQSSPEGVVIFLDEEHKTASDKAAELFGYEKFDFEELLPFFSKIVAPEDLLSFESEYYDKIIAERIPTRIEFKALHRKRGTFKARALLIPITHGEEDLIFTLSFLKKVA